MSSDYASADYAIAADRRRAVRACGAVRAGDWAGGRVHVRVVIRASGRQRGSAVRGSVRVREHVVVSASGQAARAARKSRDEIRLG